MGGATSSSAVSWNVYLPDRRRASLGGPRPKGTLVVHEDGQPDERLTVPLAVARKLQNKAKGKDAPSRPRDELLALVRELSLSCAHARMEALVDQRDYSSHELASKLLLDGYPQEVVDPLVGRAVQAGLVDDARFARVFISSKKGAGWGQARIERELARKGIEATSIEGWPDAFFDASDESERAYELASRRRLTGKNDYAKLMRFLLSRGFSGGVASGAASRVLSEASEER